MAEGFSFSLDDLYGGLGLGKLQFLSNKYQFFFSFKFCSIFGHHNPGIQPKMLAADPESTNPDPKHCRLHQYLTVSEPFLREHIMHDPRVPT
jgi:hypothetical protein